MYPRNNWYQGNPMGYLGVGGADIVGGTDFVGASPALGFSAANPMMQAAMNPMATMAAAQQQADAIQHTAHLQKQQQLITAKKLPQIFLGVDSEPQSAGGILAAGVLAITSEASVPLRITDFKVASAIAPFFNVNSITVARLNLMAGASGVPAEAWIPNAENPPIECPLLPAGSQVITTVENVDLATHRFRGGFYAIDLTPAAARIV